MKKMMTAIAACAVASLSLAAGGVTSQNVVGYSTIPVKATDFTMVGVNFVAIGGSAVAIQDYFKGPFIGGTTQPDSDNLIVWTLESGYKVYYYGVWNDPENPDWDNKWYDGDNPTTDTIPAGGACWIVRRGAATNFVFSGQVKATGTTTTIKANDFTMFSNPYPVSLAINGGLSIVSPIGGTTQPDSDNLIAWTLASGYKVYYYGVWNDPENPDWDNKWYDGDNPTTDSIGVGGAAWYVRRGAQTTMSFTSPL